MDDPARPHLSVVIPTHDTRDLTLRCLQALHESPIPRMELVLVDDASSDGTAAAALARHPGLLVLRNETTAGFTRSANLRPAPGEGGGLLARTRAHGGV